MRKKYKYDCRNWPKEINTETVLKSINDIAELGWELVSHSQTPHGMSAIFRKKK